MCERGKITAKKTNIKKDNSVSHIRKTEFSHSKNSVFDQILLIQRTIGNQAVQRLFKFGVIQTKRRICQLGDKYEQEADLVANTIMLMANQQFQRQPKVHVKNTEVSSAWKKDTAQSRKSFRDCNSYLGEHLDLIEKAIGSVTKDNIPLALEFFRYYSKHKIKKVPTEEFQKKVKEEVEFLKKRGHKPQPRKEYCRPTTLIGKVIHTGDTECDELLFEPEFPLKSLGTLLIHEFVHTHHPRMPHAAHEYLEGEAYGVEMFLAQRVGETKRINEISETALKQRKDWNKEFQVAFYTMKLLYSRIDNKKIHERAPQEIKTLKPDDARKMVAEFVSKGVKGTKDEILKKIEGWVRKDPFRAAGLF